MPSGNCFCENVAVLNAALGCYVQREERGKQMQKINNILTTNIKLPYNKTQNSLRDIEPNSINMELALYK